MKKRTKKKILKISKGTFKWIGRILFVYPAKAIAFSVKKVYAKGKENHTQKKVNKKRPKHESKHNPLTQIRSHKGKISSFEKYLNTRSSSIGIVLGARGSGKSALAMRLLENAHAKTKRKVYAMVFKPETLPSWIEVVKNLEDIHNDTNVLIDEGGI